MKKTTALAVGVSATTLFSGLVHASSASSGCFMIYGRVTERGKPAPPWTCTNQKYNGNSSCDQTPCGTNADGTEVKVSCGSSDTCDNKYA